VDQGLTEAAIIDWQVQKYGQYTLRVPPNKGWNRLAWVMPFGAIVGAAGFLVVMARRVTRRAKARPPAEAPAEKADSPKEDADLSARLDDELDELD
jgi:cytochrome c-type biogenesis protein CcmH/NrfF